MELEDGEEDGEGVEEERSAVRASGKATIRNFILQILRFDSMIL